MVLELNKNKRFTYLSEITIYISFMSVTDEFIKIKVD